jgi:hypothetical protein
MCMYHSRTRQLSCPFVVVPLLSDINVYVTLLLNAETNPQYGYGLIMDLIWLWNRIRKISGGLRIFCIIYYDTPCRCLRSQYILQVYIMLRNPDPVDSFILHVVRWDICWRWRVLWEEYSDVELFILLLAVGLCQLGWSILRRCKEIQVD